MRSGATGLVAFIGVFSLIGFATLGLALWLAHRSTVAGAWPRTRCHLAELALRVDPGSDADADGPVYGVHAVYTYVVGGRAYRGSRLAFGYTSSSDRGAHDRIYQRLKAAKSVSVRYDPANPSVSCLSFGIHHSIRFLLVFSMIWLGVCVGFISICWLSSGADDMLLRNLAVK